MAARPFRHMSRIIAKSFREPGTTTWKRPGQQPASISMIFTEAWPSTTVNAEGFEVVTYVPAVSIRIEDALAAAPERASRKASEIVDRRDTITVNGKSYRVESCSVDGLNFLRVELKTGS